MTTYRYIIYNIYIIIQPVVYRAPFGSCHYSCIKGYFTNFTYIYIIRRSLTFLFQVIIIFFLTRCFYCSGEKNTHTRLKLLLRARYTYCIYILSLLSVCVIYKVPVVVNDQTHTHTYARARSLADIFRYGLTIRESLVHTGNIWLWCVCVYCLIYRYIHNIRTYVSTRKEVDN